MPRGRQKTSDAPSELICCVCKQPKKTNPQAFANQLAKSGMAKEQFLETYTCRSCRAGNTPVPKPKPAEVVAPKPDIPEPKVVEKHLPAIYKNCMKTRFGTPIRPLGFLGGAGKSHSHVWVEVYPGDKSRSFKNHIAVEGIEGGMDAVTQYLEKNPPNPV